MTSEGIRIKQLEKQVSQLKVEREKYKAAYSVLAQQQQAEPLQEGPTESVFLEALSLAELNSVCRDLAELGFSIEKVSEKADAFFRTFLISAKRRIE